MITRVTPTSKAGRRLAQAKGARLATQPPPEIEAWNARVEKAKAEKKRAVNK